MVGSITPLSWVNATLNHGTVSLFIIIIVILPYYTLLCSDNIPCPAFPGKYPVVCRDCALTSGGAGFEKGRHSCLIPLQDTAACTWIECRRTENSHEHEEIYTHMHSHTHT